MLECWPFEGILIWVETLMIFTLQNPKQMSV
jgi:hypothetical protein